MTTKKPVWTEGLFVTQHSFQQQDNYAEELIRSRMWALGPFNWGLLDLEIDQYALSNGQLVIKRLSAILPDGTPLRCGESALPPPAARPFDTVFTPQMSALEVYVALPRESAKRANVELEQASSVSARYIRSEEQVLDYNTGGASHGVSWARPNLRVLLGNESREAYDSLCVAELVRSPAGVGVRDNYVPPVLRIGASSFLVSGFRRVLTAMITRHRVLSESRRQRTAASVVFEASDAAKFWMLNTLNDAIPEFSHFVDQQTVHPEQAYLALARFIGRMSTFAVDSGPSGVPKFSYLGLGDVFEPMFARALSLLEAVLAERFVEIPLEHRQDGMYMGKIEDVELFGHHFFLAAFGAMPENEIRDRLPKLSKIASWNNVGSILQSAVNGLRLEPSYQPPGALPIKPGVVFFAMDKTTGFWSDVQMTRTIALYYPLPKEAVSIKLYAVDPANL
jgi:type VI secretion system protein ImpJ